MVVHDLRKASKVASGQKIVSMGADNTDLEKRVSSIEYKLDTLITLLNKEANNDKTRLKPIQGNDSGI
jgi:hypothetical protein